MMSFETKTKLMPHQIDAVNKLLPTRIGGCFAEMGTGKTRIIIELVKLRQHKIDKVVYFCPVSLKETVRQQLFIHTDLTAADIYVFDDKTTEQNVPETSWYIIGIESMSSSSRVVLTANKLITENTFVILDESSYIKGHRSLRTERITEISKRARYRSILTGTPLSQGVVDLFSQMRFLSPKILGYNSFYSFAANHLEYSERFPGMIVRAHNTKYLAAKIKPYVYQVTKEECLRLPSKMYETRYCTMTWGQRRWYEKAKTEILNEIMDDSSDELASVAIFRLFSALQQIVSGFYNERLDPIKRGKKQRDKKFELHEIESNRLETLLGVINDIPKGDKIIIFCKFQYDIDNIHQALLRQFGSESCAIFCGKLSEQERNNQVAKFRQDARFFIVNQASGGHGLTLNEAHYVIFYNNGFKYSERMQAEDRCHRIGQTKPVTYIDIECLNSIDGRIAQALATKQNAVQVFRKEIEKVKKEKLKELIKAL
jgi:SNF2 family DNA or RNA helicase